MSSQVSVSLECPFCGEMMEDVSYRLVFTSKHCLCEHCGECCSITLVLKATPLNAEEVGILEQLDGRGIESLFNTRELEIAHLLTARGYAKHNPGAMLELTTLGQEAIRASTNA